MGSRHVSVCVDDGLVPTIICGIDKKNHECMTHIIYELHEGMWPLQLHTVKSMIIITILGIYMCVCVHIYVVGTTWTFPWLFGGHGGFVIYEVSNFPLLLYFFVVVCLMWLYHHMLSVSYISRESWVLWLCSLMGCVVNNRVHYEPMVIFVGLHITLLHCLKELNF